MNGGRRGRPPAVTSDHMLVAKYLPICSANSKEEARLAQLWSQYTYARRQSQKQVNAELKCSPSVSFRLESQSPHLVLHVKLAALQVGDLQSGDFSAWACFPGELLTFTSPFELECLIC